MKKLTMALAVLALTSCRFQENGNKIVLPEDETPHAAHDNTTHVEENTAVTDSTAASAEVDAQGNYIYNVGNATTLTLPNGTTLNVGENSTENKLFAMLSDAGFTVNSDKTQDWVTLDRVYFNTGSDQLTDASQTQLQNISALLQAFPEAQVKFGGYTDNTGSQAINQPLSEGRAKAVMSQVSAAGIDNARMTAEGYGAEHPICPANDTDVCKAQNRRVDIRITKK